jgi:O-antigen ligase
MTDFFDINLSLLGWPHTVACLVAVAAFFPVMFARKGGKTHRAWGRIYAIAYVVLCVNQPRNLPAQLFLLSSLARPCRTGRIGLAKSPADLERN